MPFIVVSHFVFLHAVMQVEAAKDAAAEMVEDQRQHIGKLKQVSAY